jgi:ribosomal protein S18 acetylase RimI-like enzyme
MQLRIRDVESGEDLRELTRLFVAYSESLGISLCFQNFQQELEGLPGAYAPPSGCLLLAEFDGQAGGCVALRQLADGICEMKRLYVAPGYRGTGAGRALVAAVMERAQAIGYQAIRLDTLPSMQSAIELYRSIGFKEIGPYCDNPVSGALFLECRIKGDE